MSEVNLPEKNIIWRHPTIFWVILLVGGASIVAMSFHGIVAMIRVWDVREEYGHGYIIPFITMFLIWQHKDVLEKSPFDRFPAKIKVSRNRQVVA